MNKLVACALAVFILSGCGKEQAEQDGSSAPAAAEPAAKRLGPVAAPEGERGVEDLDARGIRFDFPHSTLYDILDTSAAGTRRHRVLLEVEGGTFEDAAAKVGEALAAKGYAKTSDKNRDGRLDQVFTKPGAPAFYLIMQPAGMGPKLMKPESVGSIHIMWNM